MSVEDRQKVVEAEANRLRQKLGQPPGVLVMIDWGDGVVGSWLAAEPRSALVGFVNSMRAEAAKVGKLDH